jgi:hypothetical protein
MSKVTFDGPNKLIIVDNGETSLSVKEDMYSAWKDWIKLTDNAKYLQAFSTIGGDPLVGSLNLGDTYFLENGWKIRPYEGEHRLTVEGNLYSRDGLSPFVPTLGDFNVLISLVTSNLINTISVGGSALTTDEHDKLLEIHGNAAISKAFASNRIRINRETGEYTVYDTNNTTPLFTGTLSTADNFTDRVPA